MSCNSSGVLVASTVVYANRCHFVSIYATSTTNALFTLKVWDSDSSTISGKKEVVRLNLKGVAETLEYDMHRVLLTEGLYVEVAAGSGVFSLNYT